MITWVRSRTFAGSRKIDQQRGRELLVQAAGLMGPGTQVILKGTWLLQLALGSRSHHPEITLTAGVVPRGRRTFFGLRPRM